MIRQYKLINQNKEVTGADFKLNQQMIKIM